jgi:hypothetical protein
LTVAEKCCPIILLLTEFVKYLTQHDRAISKSKCDALGPAGLMVRIGPLAFKSAVLEDTSASHLARLKMRWPYPLRGGETEIQRAAVLPHSGSGKRRRRRDETLSLLYIRYNEEKRQIVGRLGEDFV